MPRPAPTGPAVRICIFRKYVMSKVMAGAIRMTLALALVALPAGGCLAVAAGAGAAGAIAYSERGAESRVSGNVSAIEADARAVLAGMGIAMDSHDPQGGNENQSIVSGMQGETRIRVEIERESSTTSEVMVTAREGTLDYDREMSRDILSRIMDRRR
jgi:hypothetical protein